MLQCHPECLELQRERHEILPLLRSERTESGDGSHFVILPLSRHHYSLAVLQAAGLFFMGLIVLKRADRLTGQWDEGDHGEDGHQANSHISHIPHKGVGPVSYTHLIWKSLSDIFLILHYLHRLSDFATRLASGKISPTPALSS